MFFRSDDVVGLEIVDQLGDEPCSFHAGVFLMGVDLELGLVLKDRIKLAEVVTAVHHNHSRAFVGPQKYDVRVLLQLGKGVDVTRKETALLNPGLTVRLRQFH